MVRLALYRNSTGRVTIAIVYDFSKIKGRSHKADLAKNTVPFATIEEVPVYPGCTGTRAQKSTCLNKMIAKSITHNFNSDLFQKLELSKGKIKIFVRFKIDELGKIVDVNARAPHPELKEEAMRVVGLLPQMKAGKQQGNAVGMTYTLPISFMVE